MALHIPENASHLRVIVSFVIGDVVFYGCKVTPSQRKESSGRRKPVTCEV